ncbi:hypothetical protein BDF20DRAFT_292858 [Mycotypha africana]|uniref:uncharacterized protein n=1 Tax=Mycotypha africana TaxID=64632 RepID=UPI002300D59E|nr:uncharacterized protein BDF20DRAFT_292858 [Mycotypha africana]KAI8987859.1 hypothetical protein BDF20DRAFT_292858 [Mycotypha africana]
MTTKTRLYIASTCIECRNTFNRPQALILHMERIHGIYLPSRRPGTSRPPSQQYVYEKAPLEPGSCIVHHGCPSCWEHTDDLSRLKEHIIDEHLQTSMSDYEEQQSAERQRRTHDPTTSSIYRSQERGNARKSVPTASKSNVKPSTRQQQPNTNNSAFSSQQAQTELFSVLDDLVNNFKRLFSSSTSTSSSSSSASSSQNNTATASAAAGREDEGIHVDHHHHHPSSLTATAPDSSSHSQSL